MSPASDVAAEVGLIDHCFQDAAVIELVRKQWRAPSVLWVEDDAGIRLPLLEMRGREGRELRSPYESGVILPAPSALDDARPNRRLRPLVERLLAEVRGDRHLFVQIRIPLDFLEAHGHGILEPFLLAGFGVELELWERAIDLSLGAQEIARRADERVRRKLRRGAAESPEVRFHHRETVPPAVMEDFVAAVASTRDAGGSRMKHERSLYLEDRAALIRDGKAVLASCEHEGYRGYLLALASRALGYYWDGAWSGEKSVFATHYLHYRMMLYLGELGVRRYSLGYVFPGLLSTSQKASNIAFFKDGFGDELRPVYSVTLRRRPPGARLVRGLASRAGRVLRRLPGWAPRATGDGASA
jgi:hypothetical protein